jgi:hypothetical protein
MSDMGHIVNWVNALTKSFGKARQPKNIATLRSAYSTKEFNGLVGCMLDQFHLDMRMRIGRVSVPHASGSQIWISMPAILPIYGSGEFRKVLVTLYVYRTYLLEEPLESIIAAVAHECSHVVLNAINHPLRSYEKVVDLTGMFFGYSEYFLYQPRCVGNHITLDGYLTMEERQFAAYLIKRQYSQ